MPTRYTDEEWANIIDQTERDLVVSNEPYRCPSIGSQAFMKTIDHSLLKLEARKVQFDELCAEARVDGFANVCVRPQFVQKCVADLKGTNVKVASVIGFPEGTCDLYYKAMETKYALQAGASELDVVLNYPDLKARNYASIYNELATIRLQGAHPVTLKLILETHRLDRYQIIAGCVMAAAANFDYVETSTGFNGQGANGQGATEEDVRLMAECCEKLAEGSRRGKKLKVKASGGIYTLADAVTMLEAGASRLGTSGSVWMAAEAKERLERSVSPPDPAIVKEDRPGLQTRLFTDF